MLKFFNAMMFYYRMLIVSIMNYDCVMISLVSRFSKYLWFFKSWYVIKVRIPISTCFQTVSWFCKCHNLIIQDFILCQDVSRFLIFQAGNFYCKNVYFVAISTVMKFFRLLQFRISTTTFLIMAEFQILPAFFKLLILRMTNFQ